MMIRSGTVVTGGVPEPLSVTIQEAQRLTGESRSSVYNHIASGAYEAKKSGARVLIIYDSIKRRLASLPRAEVKPGRIHKAGRRGRRR
jgi:hypothetical protein